MDDACRKGVEYARKVAVEQKSKGGRTNSQNTCTSSWPEPYIYNVYDRIFGNFSAKNAVYTSYT